MIFNDEKFEQMIHGNVKDVTKESYKSSSGRQINLGKTVKDLGILATDDLMFKEHIKKITNASKGVMGMLMRTFTTREKEPMIKMFNTYIKSKLEYCCVVWSPEQQKLINELENIQKIFTSKINGMESLNYHKRLKSLEMYSLERR